MVDVAWRDSAGAVGSPDANVTSSDLRTNLRIDLEDGITEFFVMNNLESALQTIVNR